MITTWAREGGPKEHSAKQKWQRETHSVTYVPGLSTLSDLSRIVTQPPPSFLCCLRPPSHHPSSLTSVSLVPVLHRLRPTTPFWPYGTHPFFAHAQTISILSDLLYWLTKKYSEIHVERKKWVHSVWLQKMWNSRVLPSTCAWEQQYLNKTNKQRKKASRKEWKLKAKWARRPNYCAGLPTVCPWVDTPRSSGWIT